MQDGMAWNDLYKTLFDFKEVVQQLLLGWGPQSMVQRLDLSLDAIEPADTDFVTSHGFRKSTDRLFKIRRKEGGTSYVWFHLELQRKADPWMAVRMLAYTMAIHERAVRLGLKAGQKLPGVLPLVLSQSDRPWSAPRCIEDLVEVETDDPMWRVQPKFEYVVLEACRAERRAKYPLVSGLLRAPYEPDDLSFIVDAIKGSKTIKNSAFGLAFRRWMLNLAERLWPEERRTMQQYYQDEEETDVWEAWAQRVVAKRKELERDREEARRETRQARHEIEQVRQESEQARRLAFQTLTTLLNARFGAQPTDLVKELPIAELMGLVQHAGTLDALAAYQAVEAEVLAGRG